MQLEAASVDNSLRDQNNSSHHMDAEFHNFFIIHSNISKFLTSLPPLVKFHQIIIQYVVRTFASVDEILWCYHLKPLQQYFHVALFIRGTQRQYSSKPLQHSIVKRILGFKRQIQAYFYPLRIFHLFGFLAESLLIRKLQRSKLTFSKILASKKAPENYR